jgi:hypothetical protein
MTTPHPPAPRTAHHAVAYLALGSYALLVAGVYLSPFLLSPRARQNGVFLSNLFLGSLCGLLGAVVFLIGVSLTLLRLPGWVWGRALLLAGAGAAVVTAGYAVFGSRYYAFGETASHLPPYLNGPVLVLSGVLGVLVFVLGWVWSTR